MDESDVDSELGLALTDPEEDPKNYLRQWARRLPLRTPRDLFDELEARGYIGQVAQRQAVCLAAYRHIRRIKALHADGLDRANLPPKDNLLLLGPTGCGKTFLVSKVFQEILALPTVIIDCTSLSETGYVGDDAITCLSRLRDTAGNPVTAACGVVCLDEFDKLATCANNGVFAGAGTTKDVSGAGVQRELLKMLEGCQLPVPEGGLRNSCAARAEMDTSDIMFVACGAFSGLRFAAGLRPDSVRAIGFQRAGDGCVSAAAMPESQRCAEGVDLKPDTFARYGFKPELIARFSRIVAFPALGRGDLFRILREDTLRRYRNELRLEGIALDIEPPVLERLVEESLALGSGARGLRNRLGEYLEDACFRAYSGDGRRVVLAMANGVVAVHVEGANADAARITVAATRTHVRQEERQVLPGR